MFDIGFLELTLILVVALLVIGPDRLPGLTKTAGLWLGKTRAMVRSVKADIDRELASEDLKKSLAEGAEPPDLFADIKQVAEQAGSDFHMDASGQVQKSKPSPTKSPEDTSA